MRALVLIALAACTQFDVLVNAASDEGTVYLCESGEQSKELCFYDDSADELADRLGEGWSCGSPERRWPSLTNALGLGCTYQCPAPGIGCNAKQGCYCPSHSDDDGLPARAEVLREGHDVRAHGVAVRLQDVLQRPDRLTVGTDRQLDCNDRCALAVRGAGDVHERSVSP